MGYFALSMSDEEEDIVNAIKANLKLFEDVKYDPSYIYLINSHVKYETEKLLNKLSEKLYKEFIKSAIEFDESIKTGDGSKGTPDNYMKILTEMTVYNLLDYCYEKDSSLLIEVISRSLYYNHFSDKIGDEIPCRILNFLFKKFVEEFNPQSTETSNLASLIQFSGSPYLHKVNKELWNKALIIKENCNQALTPTAKFLRILS